MCNACGFVCCASDEWGECGCDCKELKCMLYCDYCMEWGFHRTDECECDYCDKLKKYCICEDDFYE